MKNPKINTLHCLRGSHKLGLVKNRVYPVLNTEIDKDQKVKITLQTSGRQLTLFAKHPNRLNDQNGFNLRNGLNNASARFKLG